MWSSTCIFGEEYRTLPLVLLQAWVLLLWRCKIAWTLAWLMGIKSEYLHKMTHLSVVFKNQPHKLWRKSLKILNKNEIIKAAFEIIFRILVANDASEWEKVWRRFGTVDLAKICFASKIGIQAETIDLSELYCWRAHFYMLKTCVQTCWWQTLLI